MNKPLFLAACLALTPYLATAANETVEADKPAVREGEATNSGINERDRNGSTLTPMDQMNNKADLKVTQEIRQALMKGEFSLNAKNIKVITRNGKVTLRGPVNTTSELENISVLTQTMPGVKSIDNQLQVK